MHRVIKTLLNTCNLESSRSTVEEITAYKKRLKDNANCIWDNRRPMKASFIHLLGQDERNAMETLKQRVLRHIQTTGCTAHENEIKINIIIMYMNQMSDLTASVHKETALREVHFNRNSFSVCIISVPRKEKVFHSS
jgi:hypothetical protein